MAHVTSDIMSTERQRQSGEKKEKEKQNAKTRRPVEPKKAARGDNITSTISTTSCSGASAEGIAWEEEAPQHNGETH